MTAVLLCRSGNDAGLVHRITGGRCVVGRSTESNFSMLHPDLSREHCLVSQRQGIGWVLEDLESKNGTSLNGKAIVPPEALPLQHCDFVTLGRELEFVFLDLDKIPGSEVVAAALIGPDGGRVPLQLGDNTLGSSAACDLIVEDPSLAPVHLVLTLSATELKAESGPGASPFEVAGRALNAAALAPGDLLTLSETAEFGVDMLLGDGPSTLHPDAQATWRAEPKADDTAKGAVSVTHTEETRVFKAHPFEHGDSTASLPASDLAASLQRARERHVQQATSERGSETTGGFSARQKKIAAEDAAGLRRTWASKAPAPIQVAQAAGLRATRREAAARIHLVWKGERGPEERVTLLREGRHIVGREEDCRVWVTDLSVSRQHAEIHVGPNGVVVKDLASANGTWHEDKRIKELKVPAGARIRFGNVQAWFDEI